MVFYPKANFTNDIEAFVSGMLDIGDEMEQDLTEHKNMLMNTIHRIDLMVNDSNEAEVEEVLRKIVHEDLREYSNAKNLRLEFAINDFIDWFAEAKGTQEVLTGTDNEDSDGETMKVHVIEI